MGRMSYGRYDLSKPLLVTASKGDGYYDKGGAYWGSSPSEGPVWAVHTKQGDFCQYVRARSEAQAKAIVLHEYLC